MRALSGAIITAAALIGLGLTAQGIGTRYAHYYDRGEDGAVVFEGEKSQIKFKDLDNPTKLTLVVLLGCVGVGLATTFLGLAYHHHRRHHEHLHRSRGGTSPHITV
jgi:hypothetical protein